MRVAILTLIIAAITSAACADDDDWCGEVVENGAYQLRFGDLHVVFPRFLEIVIDGRSVFSDRIQRVWAHPYSGLSIAEAGDYLLVEAYEQDCVDLLLRRIFVISAAGELVVSQHVWTSFWEDAFFFEDESLVYWSAWFCHPDNADRTSKSSYVYVWPGRGGFQKVTRPLDVACSDQGIQDIRRARIEFTPLEPALRNAGDMSE